MPINLDSLDVGTAFYGTRNISKAFLGATLVFGDDAFTFDVEIPQDGNTFSLPLDSSSTINSTVDWGDSSSDTITSFDQAESTHTYATAGTYTIKMLGTVNGWAFNNAGDRLLIRDISRWGVFNWSKKSAFFGCAGLTVSALDRPLITTDEFYAEFAGCTALTEIPSLGNWDIFSLTKIQYMFYQSPNVASIDVSGWDVSNVSIFSNMFNTLVTEIGNLISIGDISGWDVSNGTSFQNMFRGTGITSINISGWDLRGTTNGNRFASGIFASCISLQSITARNIQLGNKINYMFQETQSLQSLDLTGADFSTVTETMFAFAGCDLPTIDISGFGLGALTEVEYMFQNMTNTTTVNISNLTFGPGADASTMFSIYQSNGDSSGNSSSLTSIVCEDIDASASNISLAYMFYRCISLTSLDVSTWDTSGVVDMQAMFYDTRGLTSAIVGLNSFDTSNVTNFNFVMGQEALSNGGPFGGGFIYNLSNWRLTSATNVTQMFKNNRMISSLNASNWDVGSVTNFDSMFETLDYCVTISGLHTWDVSSGVNFTQMFQNHKINTNIDVSGWNMSSATNVTQMLYDCDMFNSSLAGWDISSVESGLDTLLDQASGLSPLYYNATLIAWSALVPLTYGGTINMGGSTHTGSPAQAAKDILIADGLVFADGMP
jgi:surface protein|tara:strand:- start:1818 stop:3800 length:1983 start_codon:yes stop_codon:yes gene_type:complete